MHSRRSQITRGGRTRLHLCLPSSTVMVAAVNPRDLGSGGHPVCGMSHVEPAEVQRQAAVTTPSRAGRNLCLDDLWRRPSTAAVLVVVIQYPRLMSSPPRRRFSLSIYVHARLSTSLVFSITISRSVLRDHRSCLVTSSRMQLYTPSDPVATEEWWSQKNPSPLVKQKTRKQFRVPPEAVSRNYSVH